MTLSAAFLALVAALSLVSLARRDYERAVAFAFVFCGLAVMLFAWGNANGWIAFATWTLVSYLILNFPVASTLYLASAFCYIFGLWGWQTHIPQALSNLTGVFGLVAIWYGQPKRQRVSTDWLGSRLAIPEGDDIADGRQGLARRDKEAARWAQRQIG